MVRIYRSLGIFIAIFV